MRSLFSLFFAWVMSASAAEPLVVETVSPRTAQAQSNLVLLGQLEPVQNSQLGFELAGRVTSILVDEGDAVAAGQVLATLDTDLLRAQRRELIAAIEQAEASLTLADVSLKRLNEARSQGAVTDQNLDEAQQAKQDSEGRLAVLNAQLSGLDILKTRHCITLGHRALDRQSLSRSQFEIRGSAVTLRQTHTQAQGLAV